MLHIFDINHHVNSRLTVGGAGLDVADIGVVVTDHGCELFQHSRAVVAKNSQLYRISGATLDYVALGRLRPFHGDAPVGLIHQIIHVGAAHRMDGHTFAAGDITNNLFASNWIAAACAINQKIVITFDLDRGSLSTLAKDAPHDRA